MVWECVENEVLYHVIACCVFLCVHRLPSFGRVWNYGPRSHSKFVPTLNVEAMHVPVPLYTHFLSHLHVARYIDIGWSSKLCNPQLIWKNPLLKVLVNS